MISSMSFCRFLKLFLLSLLLDKKFINGFTLQASSNTIKRTTKATTTTTLNLSSSSSSSAAASSSSLFRDRTTEIPSIINGSATTSTITTKKNNEIPRPVATLVRIGMMIYIVSMCIALPITLLPQKVIYKMGIINRIQKEQWALKTSQICARYLLRIIPFVNIQTIGNSDETDPQPCIWVCNHQSMLDVFILLASDKKLRGKNRRQIKIVYWKNLEDNPITKLMFQQAGFIPVAMTANKPGENNEYDVKSFKKLLKDCKQAFDDGFDIGILPEGQLNPKPENGLLPIFTGAYTLARMSKRPIHMMALHGIYKLWHPINGMNVTGRNVKVRNYPIGRKYNSPDEFKNTFENVVGHFGTTGTDLSDEELDAYLTGEEPMQQK